MSRRLNRTLLLRIALLASALAGLVLATVLVAWYGFAAVGDALIAIGWRGMLLLACVHLLLMMLCGFAWRSVMPPGSRAPLGVTAGARILRDAGAELLPVTPAGGALLGARALALARVPGGLALAATVADVTLELLGQLAFTALGVALLLRGGWAPQLGTPAFVGLALGAAVAFGFLVAQRVGLFLLLERLSERLAARNAAWTLPRGDGVHAAIVEIYRNRGGLVVALGCHFLAWSATAVEAWLALRLIGAPLGLAAVLVLESLTYALKSAVFFVPSGLGVQEGGYVLLGTLLGLPPETALALSLAKRARELIIGVPALLLWQAAEARRWRMPLRPS